MEVYNLPKGSGKTRYLIQRSYITQIPILCLSEIGIRIIKDKALVMGLTIPEPIDICDYMRDYVNSNKKTKSDKLLVDEALAILSIILETDIDTVTFSER